MTYYILKSEYEKIPNQKKTKIRDFNKKMRKTLFYAHKKGEGFTNILQEGSNLVIINNYLINFNLAKGYKAVFDYVDDFSRLIYKLIDQNQNKVVTKLCLLEDEIMNDRAFMIINNNYGYDEPDYYLRYDLQPKILTSSSNFLDCKKTQAA